MNKKSIKSKKAIVIAVVGMLVVGLGVCSFVYRDKLIVFYAVNTYIPEKELPEGWIGPLFGYVTNKHLPDKLTELRAVFQGGREPSIVVKFKTEPEQTQSFLNQFTKAERGNSFFGWLKGIGASYGETEITQQLREHSIAGGYKLLYVSLDTPAWWDPETISQGLLIEYNRPNKRGHRILVSENRRVVYMYSWLY